MAVSEGGGKDTTSIVLKQHVQLVKSTIIDITSWQVVSKFTSNSGKIHFLDPYWYYHGRIIIEVYMNVY